MDGKELLSRTLKGRTVPRIPFVPLVWDFAARVMDITPVEFSSNATLLANSLQACQDLLHLDALALSPPSVLEVEACGAEVKWENDDEPEIMSYPLHNLDRVAELDISNIESRGKIPIVLEATRRLTQTLGKSVGIICSISGPVALSENLAGKALWEDCGDMKSRGSYWQSVIDLSGQILVRLLRAYCEMRPDAIIVREKGLDRLDPQHFAQLQSVFRTLHNITHFYKVCLLLYTPAQEWDEIIELHKLDTDGLSVANNQHLRAMKELALASGRVFTGCLPTNLLFGSEEDVEEAVLPLVEEASTRLYFVTTEAEIPYQTPPSNLTRVVEVLSRTALKNA